MKRLFCVILSILLFCTLSTPKARAHSVKSVRIGLYYGSNALVSANLQNVDTTGYQLGHYSGANFVSEKVISSNKITVSPSGSSFRVTDTETGSVLFTGSSDHLAIRPNSRLTWFKNNQYYGDFMYCRESSGKLTVINYVLLEDYVKGVLPYEMSADWNIEALKAQAVCTRSFALGNVDKHKSLKFDLCNTTHCQVYKGVGRATTNSDTAVDQTSGQYLMSEGALAIGYFFSSDGGATESNENVWGGEPIAYLRGVMDPYEDIASAYNGQWSVTLSAAQTSAKLKNAGYSIGTVSDIKVIKRTATNNVNQIQITDTSGKTIILKNSSVRSAFGLNSIRYMVSGETSGGTSTLNINGTASSNGSFYAVGMDGVPIAIGAAVGKSALTGSGVQQVELSATPATSVPKKPGEFTFIGTGWGHSVGMSQHGAKAMAEKGFGYEEILKLYYTGITIAES